MDVTALVLTCNDEPQLAGALGAIGAQTSPPTEVVVVNNGDPLGLDVAAAAGGVVPVRVESPPSNLGPAGGHAWGLRTFLAGSADIAWVMDDDCRPTPTALAQLLADHRDHEAHPEVVVFPAWRHRDGQLHHYPAWSGLLLPRPVVERLGLPRVELIWWTEDTEYLANRRHRLGIPVVRSDAVVDHLEARRDVVRPAWKLYYEQRNGLWYALHFTQRGWRRWRRIGRGIAAGVWIVVRSPRQGRPLALVWGIIDGLRGRLGLRWPIGATTRGRG